MDTQRLIDMLKSREEGMREHIRHAAEKGREEDRIHYIGWLRGIRGSIDLIEYLRREGKD